MPFSVALRRRPSVLLALGFSLALSLGAAPAAAPPPRLGVLVMAHGGDAGWNEVVERAVGPLSRAFLVDIAFGMAEPASLQGSLDRLAAAGVTHVVVARLFVSPESFRAQTEYLLGLSDVAPRYFMGHDAAEPPRPLRHDFEVSVSREGLMDAAEVGRILRDRVAGLSTDPRNETVLLLAHGMGDEIANDALLAAMAERAEAVRESAPYQQVVVETLREDWEVARAEAEPRIRRVVADGSATGRVIVVPFRLAGFGPYATVLEGLEYHADRLGFLPHAEIAAWLARTTEQAACAAGWDFAVAGCGSP